MSIATMLTRCSHAARSGLGFTLTLLVAALVLTVPTYAQVNALFEDFEDGTVAYTTSVAEFSDGSSDFFTRTDGSNISGSYDVTGANGSFYFAAQDIDGEGDSATQSLTFSGIYIAGLTDLSFAALVAEDDDGSSEDWDASDYVRVFASIDGAPETQIFGIENDGSTFNAPPFVDTDFDGVGDGAEITDVFSMFTAAIPGVGSTLDIRIEISLDSGDEDIAIDDVTVTGTAPSCTAAVIQSETVSGTQGISTLYSPDGLERLRLYNLMNLTVASVVGAGGETFTDSGSNDFTLDSGQTPPMSVEVTFDQVDTAVEEATYYVDAYSSCPSEQSGLLLAVLDPPLVFEASAPQRLALESSFPNPFRQNTTVGFTLPEAAEVRLLVHDVLGRRVAVLAEGTFGTGEQTVRWDGRDESGQAVAAGVYLMRLEVTTGAEQHVRTQRLLHVK